VTAALLSIVAARQPRSSRPADSGCRVAVHCVLGELIRACGTESNASLQRVFQAAGRGVSSAVGAPVGAAPGRDESREAASADRPPESFIYGRVFALEDLTLVR
jgi:hypothetical protein